MLGSRIRRSSGITRQYTEPPCEAKGAMQPRKEVTMLDGKWILLGCLGFTLGLGAGTSAVALELTVNGDFESGDTSDWASFASGTQVFSVTNDAASGSFAGELFNDIEANPMVVKQDARSERWGRTCVTYFQLACV